MYLEENITPDEKAAIEELKRRMENEITPKMRKDKSLYYRFLKARDFNIKNAEDMLRKHIAWRKEYQVDTILTDYKPPEVLLKYFPVSLIGCDKEGSPLLYHDMAGDEIGILSSAKKIDLIKYSIYLYENLLELMDEQSKKLGKIIMTSVNIYNCENLTFAKVTNKKSLEMFMLGINVFQDNYPERIKLIIDINTSRYFPILFNFTKLVIAPAVFKKIKIFGREGWQEVLLDIVNADELPAFLGGKKTDPDGNPLCHSFVVHPQEVPKHYYLKKSEKKFSKSAEAEKLILYPFSKEKLTFEIKNAHSFLEWEFETKNRDIGFGLCFKENSESEPVELVPNQRIDTYYESETRMYKCEKPGIYVISFDNSYSWLYPKEIYYKIRVLPPGELEKECN
ncbi:SEC14-like protein 2 isoform X1 [Argiope bruennichi]|uniref:SEC14-like protein 2 isoform X1 n=3 Tax=Argiope bruennichi TaxID=94029 RepID=UPI0024947B6C|nr:SEC14-like protein 2 isoform X1 [Argiope bruennichi]